MAAQVTACLAAWVASTGAASIKIQRSYDMDDRGTYGSAIALSIVDGEYRDLSVAEFGDPGELAESLAAPCARRGLSCHVMRGDVVVIHRQL